MSTIVFRPYHGDDREERLESQALEMAIKAMLHDKVVVSDTVPDGTRHFFGRMPRYATLPRSLSYPSREHSHVPYWQWEGFLKRAERRFWTLPLSQAEAKVAELHGNGCDAFVKSTRLKHFVASVPRGTSLAAELDSMIYSFIDGGPELMVQEFVEIRSEYRVFVVDGIAVTGTGKVMAHTPQDNPCEAFTSFVPDRFHGPASDKDLAEVFLRIAQEAIAEIPAKTYALDMGLINGRPGIVEANPLHLGQIGLFACDLPRLVDAVLTSCGLSSYAAAA